MSVIKGMEKCFEEKWKKLFRKGIYLGELSFFLLFFFFFFFLNLIKTDPKDKRKKLFYAISCLTTLLSIC